MFRSENAENSRMVMLSGGCKHRETPILGRIFGWNMNQATLKAVSATLCAALIGLAGTTFGARSSAAAETASGASLADLLEAAGAEPTGAVVDPTSNGVAMFAVDQVGDDLEIIRFHAATKGEAAALSELALDEGAIAVEIDTPVASVGDPLEYQQWALSSSSTSFRSAWTRTTGTGVVVAVVDSGVRKTHQDLAGATLTGIDLVTDSGDGSNDQNGHGTHVAGIIASRTNGVGIVGGAPGVKILPIRVLDENGSGFSSNVAEGIIWATDHGANVINLSLGGTTPSNASQAAIRYAIEHDVVVVAAAGNNAAVDNAPLYPGAFPESIAVGSVSSNMVRSTFSNYAEYVDVVAPGDGILSTWHSSDSAYAYMSGTSMATPYVAATAALVFANNPTFTSEQVRRRIETTANNLGPAGHDPEYGNGIIDPANASAIALPTGGDEGRGYLVVTNNGNVWAHGAAAHHGDLNGFPVGSPVVAAALTASGEGYWLATRNGRIFAFGDAVNHGQIYGSWVTSPVVAMTANLTGDGYLMLTANGSVYAFGAAMNYGSAPAGTVARDIEITSSGAGYWILVKNGEAFPFGDAEGREVMQVDNVGHGAVSFSLSADESGFWAVRGDGTVSAYGTETLGSLSTYAAGVGRHGRKLRSVSGGDGYYILTRNGAVFSFGTAKYFGSKKLSKSIAVDLLTLT